MSELNEMREPYGKANVVGEGYIRLSDYSTAFVLKHRQVIGLIAYTKAIRRIGAYLDLKVGNKEVLALSIVQMWCWRNKRVDGGPLKAIVGWSGYQASWKAQVHWGIRECLKLELLHNRQVQGGQRLGLTDKGKKVLETLEMMADKVLKEMEV